MSTRPVIQMSFTARKVGTRGPRYSSDWRESVKELARDFSNLQNYWNDYLADTLSKLPDGTGSALQKVDDFGTSLNAFTAGLDGAQLYIDTRTSASEESGLFWNTTRNRSYTVKEQIKALRTIITDTETSLTALISATSSGLTLEQKTLIGDRIFTGAASTSNSLDGKINTNNLKFKTLGGDIYNDLTYLTGAGVKTLNYSVKEVLEAIYSLHGLAADWDLDPAGMTHTFDLGAATGTLLQSKVHDSGDEAGGENDNYYAASANLYQDLNRIRTVLKDIKGNAVGQWKAVPASTLLKTGGATAVNLVDLFGDVKGTAVQTSTNPWGYAIADMAELSTWNAAAKTFMGQDADNDSTPDYTVHDSPQYLITDGDSLERAIALLDSGLDSLVNDGLIPSNSGLLPTERDAIKAFTGMDTLVDSSPDYSASGGVQRWAIDGDSLEAGIARVDSGVDRLDRIYTEVGVSGSYTLDLDVDGVFDLTLDAVTTFDCSGMSATIAKHKTTYLYPTNSGVALNFDSDWKWNGTKPTTIDSGITGMLVVTTKGVAQTDVVAAYAALGDGT